MPDDGPEFCSHHALYHEEHAATTAKLAIVMREDGLIQSELELPVADLDENAARQVLREAGRVYTLHSASACDAADFELGSADGVLTARYRSQCGADNKLGQIEIRLFDELPGLAEVEVTVVTPATQKHFAINRACGNPIFRLE